MKKNADFTEGKIVAPLLLFAVPILFALFLQAMYGAVDLMVVGKFADSTDVSAVSTGSQIMMTITNLISSLAMGTTIYLGQKIGEGDRKMGGEIIGASICLFLGIGLAFTVLVPVGAGVLAGMMNAPEEAFALTKQYIRICGIGSTVIIAYNLIGSIFRGMGDSRTPLITVMIACVCNILGDLLLVAVFHMGTRGAALATVGAQVISVVISFALIRRRQAPVQGGHGGDGGRMEKESVRALQSGALPFSFDRKQIRWNGSIIGKVVKLGIPIALQDLLVGISFLIILAIVNGLGLVASAGVGVAEKVCGFIMLVPSAFMQAMSAFVAQNKGAGRYDRAVRALWYVIGVSTVIGIGMFFLAFFHGDLLAGIFSNDTEVIAAGADYLKAYAIDCMLTCFLFCFIGFFNGMGLTGFVMVQGIAAAFLVRIPVSWYMSRQTPVSLFHIGLGIPCSTVLQILLCFGCMAVMRKKITGHAENK